LDKMYSNPMVNFNLIHCSILHELIETNFDENNVVFTF
jgi:hypothetical protein